MMVMVSIMIITTLSARPGAIIVVLVLETALVMQLNVKLFAMLNSPVKVQSVIYPLTPFITQ